jgi:aminopeptidase N
VPKFNYLGAEISAKRVLKQEVRTQARRAAGISGCLYNLIWLNKYMSTESKVRIYKTNVRPVLTYVSETRAETTNIQQLLRTTEMKTIRAIHGKTLRDKIRSDQRRQLSGIQDIIKWTNVRRKELDAHVERMDDNRLAKISRDNRAQGVRSRGRPKKRWKESLNAAPSP